MADGAADDAPPEKKKSGWAHWVTIVSLIVGIVALVWTVQSLGLSLILAELSSIGWWFAVIAAIEVLITGLDAAAMYQFLSPDQGKIPYRRALLAQMSGRAVNAVVPSGNVGEVVKVSVLVEGGVPDARAVSCILIYNLAGLLAELTMVAIGAPIIALLVPMGWGLRVLLLGTTVFCVVVAFGLILLVQKGMLVTFARLARRIRLISQARFDRWHDKLAAIDEKIRLDGGGRKRDRWLGVTLVYISRAVSWGTIAVLLHALGFRIELGFFAAVTVGGFAIYLVSTFVPLGLGVSEGGNAALYGALGYNPVVGVTITFAKRAREVVYAAIGLVLLLASETVQEARKRSKRR